MNGINPAKSIRFLVVCLCLILCISAFGSVSAAGAAGKYISEKNANDYLELKADGTFLLQGQGQSVSGRYKIEGTQITLTLGSGQALRGKLEGKTFVDDAGNRFTKR